MMWIDKTSKNVIICEEISIVTFDDQISTSDKSSTDATLIDISCFEQDCPTCINSLNPELKWQQLQQWFIERNLPI